uniref:Putative secreted protein n=1 Tax=Anopheles marajoara TaxID=58244 RepID=A0A2M4CD07_9DIPT
MSAPVMSWRKLSAIFLSVRSAANWNRPVTARSTLSFSSTVLLGPTYSSLSNRPGRNSAGSIRSGRLVAASMKIC